MPTPRSLRDDALAIWHSAVDRVRADRLVRESVQVQGGLLHIGQQCFDLRNIRRLIVVGAGKAGAGMAAGLEETLGPDIAQQKQLEGWVNVPADCMRSLSYIRLHPARPAGINEPTEAGVYGAEQIVRLVASAGPEDLCLCLLSGGASALLPLPRQGISLADKQAVTRHLSAAGANIAELNTVRKQLSRIKGGGLARLCRAGWLITLVISDVLGDPLDVIGSGPTVPDLSTPADALAVLARYGAHAAGIPQRVFDVLRAPCSTPEPPRCHVEHLIIGNNALAADAAGREAVRLGYEPVVTSATQLEGEAEQVGRQLAQQALSMAEGGPNCLVSGGEPVVRLVPAQKRGRGGRNQQLVLAAMLEVMRASMQTGEGRWPPLILLSGGTDGEDGPTDAAGALADAEVYERICKLGLDPASHLARNDAYPLFDAAGGLIKTGPTHTNVCDVRVALWGRGRNST